MSSIHQFFQNADFHGLRHAFDTNANALRRCLWFVVILFSQVILILFIHSRVNYLYTYPSAYNIIANPDFAPVPAVTLCPPWNKVVLPPSSEWHELTDNEVVFLVHYGLKTPILHPAHDGDAEEYTLNNTWMNYFLNLNYSNNFYDYSTQLCQNPGGSEWIHGKIVRDCNNLASGWWGAGLHSLQPQFLDTVVRRIKILQRNVRFNRKRDLVKFFKRFGVSNDMVSECSLVRVNSNEKLNCLNSVHPTWTPSYGFCMTFDNINGSSAFYLDQHRDSSAFFSNSPWGGNIFVLHAKPSFQRYMESLAFLILIHDANEIPDIQYRSVIDVRQLYYSHKMDLTVRDLYKQKVLDVPHGNHKCVDQRYSHCLDDCIGQVSRVGNISYLPEAEDEADELLETCKLQCPQSCEYMSFSIKLEYQEWHESNQNYRVSISLPPRTVYLEYIQEVLYTPLVLLAEVGGYIGLFIGASILSVYHLLEYIMMFMLNRFIKRTEETTVARMARQWN